MHSDVNGLLSALVKEAVTNQQWRWREGIVLQLGKLQWQLYWEISVLLVCFFIAQMSVFLNSLLIGIVVKEILGIQFTEHVLLFDFSICELLGAGCNHVSC